MLTPLKVRIVEENGNKYYGTLISDFWWDIGATPSSEGSVELKSGKKPEKLLKRILSLCTAENDIVLDFFLGSGSTAATAMKMKRRFIGVEQLFYGENDSLKRLENVIKGDQTGISKDKNVNWNGGGSFVYAELKSINQSFIEELIEAKNDEDVLSIFKNVFNQGFISYRLKEISLDKIEKEFINLSFDEKKNFVKEILDKNLLYLPYSEIDDTDFTIDNNTKKLNQTFYNYVPS